MLCAQATHTCIPIRTIIPSILNLIAMAGRTQTCKISYGSPTPREIFLSQTYQYQQAGHHASQFPISQRQRLNSIQVHSDLNHSPTNSPRHLDLESWRDLGNCLAGPIQYASSGIRKHRILSKRSDLSENSFGRSKLPTAKLKPNIPLLSYPYERIRTRGTSHQCSTFSHRSSYNLSNASFQKQPHSLSTRFYTSSDNEFPAPNQRSTFCTEQVLPADTILQLSQTSQRPQNDSLGQSKFSNARYVPQHALDIAWLPLPQVSDSCKIFSLPKPNERCVEEPVTYRSDIEETRLCGTDLTTQEAPKISTNLSQPHYPDPREFCAVTWKEQDHVWAALAPTRNSFCEMTGIHLQHEDMRCLSMGYNAAWDEIKRKLLTWVFEEFSPDISEESRFRVLIRDVAEQSHELPGYARIGREVIGLASSSNNEKQNTFFKDGELTLKVEQVLFKLDKWFGLMGDFRNTPNWPVSCSEAIDLI